MSASPTFSTTSVSLRPLVRPRRKPRSAASTLNRFLAFGTIACASYLVSSLAGQVMVEKARREGIRAVGRATSARKVEEELNKRLNQLTSLQSIQGWAKAHQFFTPAELVQAGATKTPKEAANEESQ